MLLPYTHLHCPCVFLLHKKKSCQIQSCELQNGISKGLNGGALAIQVSLLSQHLSESMCDGAAEELFQNLLSVGETCCPAQQ